jgi:hypothetical protein
MREAIIIGAVVGLFFFACGAAVSALAIKYSTNSLLWDFVLWGGVAIMLGSITTLGLYISSQLRGRAFMGPALLINLGICLIVFGAVWHFTPTDAKNDQASVPSLEGLFKSDFGLMSMNRQASIKVEDPAKSFEANVDVPIKIFRDFSSNTEFVSAFVPFFVDARMDGMVEPVIDHLKSLIKQWLQESKQVRVGMGTPSGIARSDDLVFSGRVFVYTMNLLDAVQIGRLTESYRKDNMFLEFRGAQYLTQRSLAK